MLCIISGQEQGYGRTGIGEVEGFMFCVNSMAIDPKFNPKLF